MHGGRPSHARHPLRILHSACIESRADDDDDVTPKVLTDDRTNARSPVTRNSARARQMCQLPSAAPSPCPTRSRLRRRIWPFLCVRVCPFPRHFSSQRDLCICLRNSQCGYRGVSHLPPDVTFSTLSLTHIHFCRKTFVLLLSSRRGRRGRRRCSR